MPDIVYGALRKKLYLRQCRKKFSIFCNQWKKNSDNGKFERAFCQFIMSPICKMFEAIMEDKKLKIQKMLTAVGVVLKGDEKVSQIFSYNIFH